MLNVRFFKWWQYLIDNNKANGMCLCPQNENQ